MDSFGWVDINPVQLAERVCPASSSWGSKKARCLPPGLVMPKPTKAWLWKVGWHVVQVEPVSTWERGGPSWEGSALLLGGLDLLFGAVLLCLHCSSASDPYFPFAEAAWPLPSLTAQPRDSKIQFISSINSINKQNSTDQRTSIAINTAIHVAKWSYFS